jgi:hypothetical protein
VQCGYDGVAREVAQQVLGLVPAHAALEPVRVEHAGYPLHDDYYYCSFTTAINTTNTTVSSATKLTNLLAQDGRRSSCW